MDQEDENTIESPSAGIALPVRVRKVTVDHSGRWLAAGWRDFKQTPAVSLTYGGFFVVISFVLTFGLVEVGLGSMVLPLAGGFMLVAPLGVVGLYDVSRHLERGAPVSLGVVCRACRARADQIGAMGVVLTLFLLAWILIALTLFALAFHQGPPPLERFLEDVVFSLDGAVLLLLGTAMGAVLAAGMFTITAVSIPMLLDRDIDVVTAMVVSVHAVAANWQVMIGWAAMIGALTVVGLATFFIGLAVVLPLLGYATWHAYRDLVESEAPGDGPQA